MSEVPVELVIAAFQTEDGAENALKQLQQANKAHWIDIDNAAVIRRDAADKLHIKDVKDMTGRRGAAIGGVVGGVLGILFPPTLLASAAIGAGVGGLAAKLHDGGFDDRRLRDLGESLKPGTSAIVAVIEHTWVIEAEQALAEEGARVVVESVKADIAQQLAAGREVGYSALQTDEALSIDRIAVGKDSLEASNLTVTAEGLTGVSVVADEKSAQVAALVANDEGIAVLSGELKPAELPAAEASSETPAEAATDAPSAAAAEPPAGEAKESGEQAA
jgi:uncharacterized membrane protein